MITALKITADRTKQRIYILSILPLGIELKYSRAEFSQRLRLRNKHRNTPRLWHQRGRRGTRIQANELAQTARQTGEGVGREGSSEARAHEASRRVRRSHQPS